MRLTTEEEKEIMEEWPLAEMLDELREVVFIKLENEFMEFEEVLQ